MLLNLLRVEEADPDYMMARSFRQFQKTREAPRLQTKVDALLEERDAIQVGSILGTHSLFIPFFCLFLTSPQL
jgi:superfamily II RNA helicase